MYKTMHNLRNRSKDKKGFTLAELLIVVAIIAVLVAIAIPLFTGQLEKAREAADIANIRAAYAEACVSALNSADGVGTATSEPMVSDGTFEADPVIGGQTFDIEFETGDVIKVSVATNGTITFTAE